MLLIVGLGNPGVEYERTYHNVGFLVIEELARRFNVKITKKSCLGKIARFEYCGTDVILAKPLTYMNRSGECVAKLKKKFNLKDQEIIVINDDIDIEKGKFRFRESGSAGTHNGLRSIVFSLGSTAFKRIRVGIGKADGDLSEYVLSKISREDYSNIHQVIELVVEFIIQEILG